MTIQTLHIGQRVRHPQYGLGMVKGLDEHTAEVRFEDGSLRRLAPEASGLAPAEALAAVTGLQIPLALLVKEVTEAAIEALGLERPHSVVERLASRWHGGRMVLHSHDPTLQTKEVELDVFFHKIVMVRNNLRVLEQKINGHPALNEAEKIEWQQYVTRCYGSLTTFNLLFKEKEDQF